MKPSFLCLVFIIFYSSSTLVRSQDSCSSKLDPGLISYNAKGLRNFDASSLRWCFIVWETHNFILRYYAQASPNSWTLVLSYPLDINSYAAIGFSKDGQMLGSGAVVGWVENDAQVKWYYLGGTTPEQVIVHGQAEFSWNATIYRSGGSTTAYISAQLEASQPSPYLLFAVGPQNSFPSGANFLLPKHSDKISVEMDYASGKARVTSNLKLKRGHGWLNIVGWSLLMIIGAIVARHCKQWDPIWFYLHASIQTTGFVAGVVGILCGLILSKKVSSNITHHKNIGILILVLGFLQVMAFVLRPGKESKIRKYWTYYHHNIGRILMIFAFANAFYGLHLGREGSKYFAGYGISVAILVIVAIILEIRMRMKSKSELPNYGISF